MKKRKQIKPFVDEISLAFNPKNRKKFFLIKDEEKNMDELIQILKEQEPLLQEEKVNQLIKDRKLSEKGSEALKGVLRILNKNKDEFPKGILSSLAQAVPDYGMYADVQETEEEKKKRIEELEKKCKERFMKDLKKDEKAFQLLKDSNDQLRKDLEDSRKVTQEIKDNLRQSEIKMLLKDTGVFGDLNVKSARMLKLEKVDPELFDDMMKDQKKNVDMLRAAGIESEIGSEQLGDLSKDSAYKKIQAKVDEILEKDSNANPVKAWKMVIKKNPDLYKDYLDERDGGR